MGNRDLVLLRTGFGARRESAAYLDGPYLAPDAAHLLREVCGLRCLGIDCLSISNPARKEVGDEVHRILLDPAPDGKPILLLEDADLRAIEVIRRFRRVFTVPLFLDGVDGMPCTVFGEYEE